MVLLQGLSVNQSGAVQTNQEAEKHNLKVTYFGADNRIFNCGL